jgi:heme/copper-type cytochrome/quinol oxidase subunit 2
MMRGIWIRLQLALLAVLFLLITNETWACVVCGTAKEASRKAFIYTTAALSLIPLMMIGGLIFYLYWMTNRRQKREQTSQVEPEGEIDISNP